MLRVWSSNGGLQVLSKISLTLLFHGFRILEEEQNFDLFSLHHAQAQHMTALNQASVVF